MKKSLGAQRVIKRYHNKHVDGSGNFGFTIIHTNVWFTLNGSYDESGVLLYLYVDNYSYGMRRFVLQDDVMAQIRDFIDNRLVEEVTRILSG